jgi:phosphoribosylformylglycinamidine synthase
VAEGGLAVALAECCLAGGLGAVVELDVADEALLFGEGPGAFVVSGPADALRAFGAHARVLGEVGGDALALGAGVSIALAELEAVHADGLARLL